MSAGMVAIAAAARLPTTADSRPASAVAAVPNPMVALATARMSALTLNTPPTMPPAGRVAPLAAVLGAGVDVAARAIPADDAVAFMNAYGDPAPLAIFPGPIAVLITSFGEGDYQKAVVSKVLTTTSASNPHHDYLTAAARQHEQNPDTANILLYARLMRQLIEVAEKNDPVQLPAAASAQSAPVSVVQQPAPSQTQSASLVAPPAPKPSFAAVADEMLLLRRRFEARAAELAEITEFPLLATAPIEEQPFILRALLRYCPNLNTITFHNGNNNSGQVASDEALLLLPQFPNLTKLCFVGKERTNLGINGPLLLQILPQLVRLQHFAHNQEFFSSEGHLVSVDQLLQVMPQSVNSLNITPSSPWYDLLYKNGHPSTFNALSRLPALVYLRMPYFTLEAVHIGKLPIGLQLLECGIQNNAIPILAKRCRSLEYCYLTGTKWNDASSITGEHFGAFSETLRRFSCTNVKTMTDQWMGQFSKYPCLDFLAVEFALYSDFCEHFTGATLNALPPLLKILRITDAKSVRSENVDLSHLTQLVELDVSGTSINYTKISPSLVRLTAHNVFADDDMHDLRNHPNLQELDVTRSYRLTGRYTMRKGAWETAREYISSSYLPRNVKVFNCSWGGWRSGASLITDEYIRPLENHPSLEHLIMDNTGITGENFHMLPPKLRHFSMKGCSKIDQASLERLQKRILEKQTLLQYIPPAVREQALQAVPILEIVTTPY